MALLLPTSNDGRGDSADAFRVNGKAHTAHTAPGPADRKVAIGVVGTDSAQVVKASVGEMCAFRAREVSASRGEETRADTKPGVPWSSRHPR
jgi:hypothetical protein